MVGHNATDVLKSTSLSGTHHIHHAVAAGPLLTLAQHLFKEAFALLVGHELEVVATLVAGECQQHHPLVLVGEEGRDTVFAHIGSHRDSIQVGLLKEGAGIHGAGVADVATLGICDDELVGMMLTQIGDGLLEGYPAPHAHAFIEGKVGLVGHTVGCGGIDNGLVETEDGVFLLQQAGRELADVGIQPHAKETLFPAYVLKNLFFCHSSLSFIRSAFSATIRWSIQS